MSAGFINGAFKPTFILSPHLLGTEPGASCTVSKDSMAEIHPTFYTTFYHEEGWERETLNMLWWGKQLKPREAPLRPSGELRDQDCKNGLMGLEEQLPAHTSAHNHV